MDDMQIKEFDAEEVRDVAFWLSVEDYIMALAVPAPAAQTARRFITWRAAPCIVIGKYQIAEAEVDLAEARRRHVDVTRRSSGGGAVFIDPGAVQYAMIEPFAPGMGEDAMRAARTDVAGVVARALKQQFGVPASVEGRNDVTVNGAKVSGLSQLTRGGWLNTHGTLLYDSDLDILSKLLKPDTAKFQSKAVQSVRSRVLNVRPLLGGRDAGGAGAFMKEFSAAVMSDADSRGRPLIGFTPTLRQLGEIEKTRIEVYANPLNTYSKSPPYTYRAARRFPGGKVEFFADVKVGVLSSCAIRGDFIGSAAIEALENKFCGLPFRMEAFESAVSDGAVKDCLGGITKAEFLNFLFSDEK